MEILRLDFVEAADKIVAAPLFDRRSPCALFLSALL